jgi:hypothetical protein
MIAEVSMKRLLLAAGAAFLMAGCYQAAAIGHVKYRMYGTSKSVLLDSILVNNAVRRLANPHVTLPWTYEFDGVADMQLGLTASKYDEGSLHVSIYVEGSKLAADSVPCADIGGSVTIYAEWP